MHGAVKWIVVVVALAACLVLIAMGGREPEPCSRMVVLTNVVADYLEAGEGTADEVEPLLVELDAATAACRATVEDRWNGR